VDKLSYDLGMFVYRASVQAGLEGAVCRVLNVVHEFSHSLRGQPKAGANVFSTYPHRLRIFLFSLPNI
jgi:hypothetical protein